jgi:hypothetical protein
MAGAFLGECEAATERLDLGLSAPADWEELVAERHRSNVLARACLQQLAQLVPRLHS